MVFSCLGIQGTVFTVFVCADFWYSLRRPATGDGETFPTGILANCHTVRLLITYAPAEAADAAPRSNELDRLPTTTPRASRNATPRQALGRSLWVRSAAPFEPRDTATR